MSKNYPDFSEVVTKYSDITAKRMRTGDNDGSLKYKDIIFTLNWIGGGTSYSADNLVTGEYKEFGKIRELTVWVNSNWLIGER